MGIHLGGGCSKQKPKATLQKAYTEEMGGQNRELLPRGPWLSLRRHRPPPFLREPSAKWGCALLPAGALGHTPERRSA